MGLLSVPTLIDPRVSERATRQAMRLADERKVFLKVRDRNADWKSVSNSLRAAACARVSIRSLLLEGR
jgi:hypothetical protein